MQGNDRQAYDRGTSLFSPDGRIYQVEYAREAVKRGSPSVGIRASDGVVLAAERRVRSELLEPRSIEKLHKVDDHIGVASAGHVADARQLVDVGRRAAQIEGLRYGQPITTEQLTTEISEHIQEYTQAGGTRPYGAALLVGGYVDEPRLFETDPSGTPYEWRATAIGGGKSFDSGPATTAVRRLAFFMLWFNAVLIESTWTERTSWNATAASIIFSPVSSIRSSCHPLLRTLSTVPISANRSSTT